MPITSGLTGWGSPLSIWQNIAQTSNQGVEVILNSHNIQHKDFTWNTTLSATWSKEKIDKLPDGDQISENLFTGEPIHAIYGYKYAGIWGSDTPKETLDAYGVNPGFIKIETVDKNGDGGVHKYSTDDRQILGHTNPDWIIGLNNSFTYKNFDLSVFAMARYGQTINSDLLGYYTAEQSVTKNQLAGVDLLDRGQSGRILPASRNGRRTKNGISFAESTRRLLHQDQEYHFGIYPPRQHFPQGIDGEMPHLRYGLQSVHLCERQATEGHRPRNERFGRVSHLSAICIWS